MTLQDVVEKWMRHPQKPTDVTWVDFDAYLAAYEARGLSAEVASLARGVLEAIRGCDAPPPNDFFVYENPDAVVYTWAFQGGGEAYATCDADESCLKVTCGADGGVAFYLDRRAT